jgi:quinoprotein glucose dehydrogenase
MKGIPFSLAAAWLASLVTPSALAETAMVLKREFAACSLERPITVVIPPDGSQRLFLAQQTGKILILPADRSASQTKTFLDVSGLMAVENDFEEGLVGFAFHPKYKENGRFFTCYAQQNPKINRLSEWRVDPQNPDAADPASEKVLLEIPRPFWNHNSGTLLFGPDGYLYFSVGDGGKRDDAARLAQNLFVMNGKILRLDVDNRTGRRAYGIPGDNPFVKTEGALPEIWAYGLRNPWGLAFDPATGTLWCADVGQDQFEEINIITKGGNYGWSFREGAHPFTLVAATPPKGAKLIEPIHEYSRDQGISITGGLVYRGSAHPTLRGAYIYGDWGSGRVWALETEGPDHSVKANTLIIAPEDTLPNLAKPTAFCEDASQELLVLDWNGRLFSLAPRAR